MQKKSKILFLIACFLFFSSAVIGAGVSNGVLFFLPSEKMGAVDSFQASKVEKMRAGQDFNPNIRTDFVETKAEKTYGVGVPSGVSLVNLEPKKRAFALENTLQPARFLILPEMTSGQKKKAKKAPVEDSLLPTQYKVFPMENLLKEIKKVAEERPLTYTYDPLFPPEPKTNHRPQEVLEWTKWVLDSLQHCEIDANEVFPTLYWLTNEKLLSKGHTDCSMKQVVAKYLQKCHPWPIEYYTPVNNDIVVPLGVQLAVDYMENTFQTKTCPVLDLTNVNFEKVDFVEGNLAGADFSNSYFNEATFSGTVLSETLFNNANLNNTLFQNLTLSNASFKKAEMKFAHLHHVKADGAIFDNADLQNTQFRDVGLSFASFNDTNLQNVAWTDVRARRLNANNASFYKANFDNALLSQLSAVKSDFSNSVCENCSFNFAELEGAFFSKAHFDNVTFEDAFLKGADFSSAVFEGDFNFKNAFLYQADFSDVDLTRFASFDIKKLRQLNVDARTIPPTGLEDYQAAEYDVEIFNAMSSPLDDVNRYSCTQQTCEDRLLGHVSSQNLAVRAMTMISNSEENLSNQVWALCTMGCIAKNDKKFTSSQLRILAEFLKRKIPWTAEKDLFKPYTPIPPEAQMALYLITAPDFNASLPDTLDLTHLDLRKADLSYSDLTNIDLSGSFLAGTDFFKAKTKNEALHFDQAVVDEYTIFPERMESFRAFSLPDSPTPPWWKPATVKVYKNGSHPWTVVTEDIPLTDEMIVEIKNK